MRSYPDVVSPFFFVSSVFFSLAYNKFLKVGKNPRNDHQKISAVLPCIQNRHSVFPRDYAKNEVVSPGVMNRLLESAMWAPFHGPSPPWRFVVLGKQSMVQMQRLTISYYDENWRSVGWADGKKGPEKEYLKWRKRTEEEIYGRWGPVSYMVAIIMRRQAGSKRIPEWEEAAATACAVQNMHLQATAHPRLACYWSSWHEAVCNSTSMHCFLGMEPEDKCLGFFIVAMREQEINKKKQRSSEKHLDVEWRG